jgi:UDP-4-amino-4-deoxy-L-arabinose formyltransferase/UDP-glucuronic acid dehydrogenase (UDP-4-keto-hexauronic acid decarboxylating)
MSTAVVFAYHGFGHAGLSALLRQGWQILLVLSHADHPGENCWWPAVAALCQERGIPCLLDADVKDPALVARLAALKPDAIFSFYFRSMIPQAILDLCPGRAFNLHGSLLPTFRGRSPVNWQLVHGEHQSGLTLHQMVKKADAGDLVAQIAVGIHPDQDAYGLTRQLLAVAPAFLDTAVQAIRVGSHRTTPQDHTKASYFGGRKPADGAIDPDWPARRIHDLVRAVAPPWPGAFVLADGRKLMVWRTAVIADDGQHGPAGHVLADSSIACGTGRLAILSAGWAPDDAPACLSPGSRLTVLESTP